MKSRFSILATVIALVIVGSFAFATSPVSADMGAEILEHHIHANECYVDIVVRVQDAGYYAVNIWDDGVYFSGIGAVFAAGETFVARFTVGNRIGEIRSGAGIYVEDGLGLDANTTFANDDHAHLWTDTEWEACGARSLSVNAELIREGEWLYPLPASAVLYNVPLGAYAYYAPDLNTATGFTLPAGTWWITEFTGDFAKVWMSGRATPFYIPADSVLR